MRETINAAYVPAEKHGPVVERGAFCFGAVALEHGHIYGMCNGLIQAGATLKWVYDPDSQKTQAFRKVYPQARAARCLEEILEDGEIRLISGAAVPSQRCALGLQVLAARKDYFTDKAPFTSLDQLAKAQAATRETGRKYMVYYSERLHSESAVYAGELIRRGAIGQVIQVLGLGPHRLSAPTRPQWFFEKKHYGGILTDIGSHQIEQFLYYSGAKEAVVRYARTENFSHPEYPQLEDFGDCALQGDNGAANYFRVDWFTPDGLRAWGDGRTVILGTQGYIELRKYVEVGRSAQGDQVYLVNGEGESHFSAAGKVGFPFFGELILDCLNRTENAMTQAHAFKAAELSIRAQMRADACRD